MTAWRTTVTEAVLIFRDALRCLVSHLTKARIEWREGLSYDDWDEIAQTLFQKMVVASVQWAVRNTSVAALSSLQTMMCGSYEGKSVIMVDSAAVGRLVFHSLGTRENPFDTVRARRVDDQGRVTSHDFVALPCDGVIFRVPTPSRTVEDLLVDV